MTLRSNQQGILLESGTNEVEIIEFYIGEQSFGVNVAKVKQILQFKDELLTEVPQAHPSLKGLFFFRERTIPLVNLSKALDYPESGNCEKPLVLVTEFNGITNGFLIDGVNRIHRVSWEDLQPINPFLEGYVSSFTGSINIDGKEILIVDLEQIIAEINPATSLDVVPDELAEDEAKHEVEDIRVIMAEDSTYIRNALKKSLTSSGFNLLEAFDNGLSAFEYLKALKEKANLENKKPSDFLDIIITDIEMPKMDGLTLCRNIKQSLSIRDIPVLAFSSLINEQMAKKCQEVGMDAYTSKPRIENLRHIILESLYEFRELRRKAGTSSGRACPAP